MRIIIFSILLTISLKAYSQENIFATIGGGDLYSFDLSNCTRKYIGATSQNFGDIAFTSDGQLWGVINNQLYNIDTSTANINLIGTMSIFVNSLVEMNDSLLLSVSDKKLFSINIHNAISTYIDTIGYDADGDLTWYDNDLYLVTANTTNKDSLMVKIVLNNTNTAILSVTEIGNSIPLCAGAITTTFPGQYNAIVGFNGPDLIKICQIDGSTQMLCPNLNIGGTPGAASKRLATQAVQPTFCNTLGLQDYLPQHHFSIYPNPTNNDIHIKEKVSNKCKFNIYNVIGHRVKTGVLQVNNSIIFVGDLSEGLYTIELIENNKYEIQKFVVKK